MPDTPPLPPIPPFAVAGPIDTRADPPADPPTELPAELPIAFDPVPARRPRRDGWTVERQEAFLKALANCGCVTHACRAVGMSRESAYNLYNRESAVAFRRGWDAALDCSLRLVEDEAWSRAIRGVARPVFYQGEQVGEYRHFDERLTMFLLRFRRPHRYADVPKFLPPPPPPGLEDLGPDPDEGIGLLDYHLGDLEDEAALPGAGDGDPAPIDAVNFVNLSLSSRAQQSCVEETAKAGRRVAQRARSTSRDLLP